MKYGIKTYGPYNIQCRSRIEAKWAWFFEKCKWNWEYEPIDLHFYIPDFIVTFGTKNILVEIKCDTVLSSLSKYQSKIQKSGWTDSYVILGGKIWYDLPKQKIYIGITNESKNVELLYCPTCSTYAIFHSKCIQCQGSLKSPAFTEVRHLWSECCNLTQWTKTPSFSKFCPYTSIDTSQIVTLYKICLDETIWKWDIESKIWKLTIDSNLYYDVRDYFLSQIQQHKIKLESLPFSEWKTYKDIYTDLENYEIRLQDMSNIREYVHEIKWKLYDGCFMDVDTAFHCEHGLSWDIYSKSKSIRTRNMFCKGYFQKELLSKTNISKCSKQEKKILGYMFLQEQGSLQSVQITGNILLFKSWLQTLWKYETPFTWNHHVPNRKSFVYTKSPVKLHISWNPYDLSFEDLLEGALFYYTSPF